MYKSLPMNIHEKISNSLLNPFFLREISLSSSVIQDLINRPSFVEILGRIADDEDYTCKAAYELCKELINEQGKNINIDNWLYYIYQYTLNKSFPEAVVINLEKPPPP